MCVSRHVCALGVVDELLLLSIDGVTVEPAPPPLGTACTEDPFPEANIDGSPTTADDANNEEEDATDVDVVGGGTNDPSPFSELFMVIPETRRPVNTLLHIHYPPSTHY